MIRSAVRESPRWRLECLASPSTDEWVPMVNPEGRPLRFVEREDAERELARLLRIQPHAQMRITPM